MGKAIERPRAPSAVRTMAARYQVDDDKLLKTLKATCFKGSISDEQMMALMVVIQAQSVYP
jgi:hypothetical protein